MPRHEDLHRVRSALHVAQKVGEVVGRDHDVQQELQSEEKGRWVLHGGGEGRDDDDDDGGGAVAAPFSPAIWTQKTSPIFAKRSYLY